MEELNVNLANILKQMKNSSVKVTSLKSINCRKKSIWKTKKHEQIIGVVILIVGIVLWEWDLFTNEKCLIEMPSSVSKAFRMPEKCDFCSNIREIEKLSNLSPNLFEKKYAYSATPLVVTDATSNWTAPSKFDFWYFKDVYENAKRKRKILSCQFFPYKSGLKNLYDALSISEKRVNYDSGEAPWYFGWSNCNHEVAKILRKHYNRPYFLPETSENNAIDWIFMGGPGMGAHMHVDNVRLPSWQAQLKGSKEWILAPPPECYYKCSFFRIVVNPGEIIILDTNKWYHQTIIKSGEISVTIGAEYD